MDYLSNGFLRLTHIIGDRRKSPAVPGLIPISRSGWWAGVKAGRYPKPIKLSPRVTVWRAKDIFDLIHNCEKSGDQVTSNREKDIGFNGRLSP